MDEIQLSLKNEAATWQFGALLGGLLQPGDVVGLVGDLGVGKTRLTQAMSAGLGVAVEAVNSPTFSLIQEYVGRCPVRHCDTYRLREPEEFADLGLDELFGIDGVAIIEWADRVLDYLPREYLEIRISASDVTARQLIVKGVGLRGRELLSEIAKHWPT